MSKNFIQIGESHFYFVNDQLSFAEASQDFYDKFCAHLRSAYPHPIGGTMTLDTYPALVHFIDDYQSPGTIWADSVSITDMSTGLAQALRMMPAPTLIVPKE